MQKTNESVESSARILKNLIENSEDILRILPKDDDTCLPTWWTNKLAVSSAYIDSLRDYITYNTEQDDDKNPTEESYEDEDEDEDGTEYQESYEDDMYMIPPSVRMVRDAS